MSRCVLVVLFLSLVNLGKLMVYFYIRDVCLRAYAVFARSRYSLGVPLTELMI